MSEVIERQQINSLFRNREYYFFDGEEFITFNVEFIDVLNDKISVVISDRGKIIFTSFDLLDVSNDPYFEYGVMRDKIYLNDFEEVA